MSRNNDLYTRSIAVFIHNKVRRTIPFIHKAYLHTCCELQWTYKQRENLLHIKNGTSLAYLPLKSGVQLNPTDRAFNRLSFNVLLSISYLYDPMSRDTRIRRNMSRGTT